MMPQGVERPEITSATLAYITKHEGVRLTRYRDAVGYWTIGVGHLLKAGENLTRITQREAAALLRQDLQIAAGALSRLVRVALSQNQFTALLSFTFNLGEGNLKKSALLRKLNASDYAGAADEFLKWNRAGGRVLRGLVKRRADERRLFLTPDFREGER